MLEGAREQEKVPTLDGGASDVLSKNRPKVLEDTMEAAAVDEAKDRRQLQVFAAKVSDFKHGCVGLSGGKPAAAFDCRCAIVHSENAKAISSQPPADFTSTAAHVDNALIFRKPVRVDCFDEFLLRLVGFPKGVIFGIAPLVLPSTTTTAVRPIGEELFDPTLHLACQSARNTHG